MKAFSPSPPARKALLLFGGATLIGLLFAAQIYFSSVTLGHPVSWGQAAYWALGDWYEWALLAPLIFRLAARFELDRKHWPRNLAVHLAAGLLFATAHAGMCALAEGLQAWRQATPYSFSHSALRLLGGRMHFNLAVYAMIVAGWHAWLYQCRYREREARAADLSVRLARAELQALRMQLNPHFLYNTLNTVSSLMLRDTSTANKVLSRLGDLLRVSLDTSGQQLTPLRQELEFLRRYLEIEQARFGERLAIHWEVPPALLDAVVPSLLLQPLVENAVRHGIERQSAPGSITVRATRNNGSLVLEVVDTGPGLNQPAPRAAHDGQGIGLANTRERLRQLYGDHQQLNLRERTGGGLVVSVALPYEVVPPAARN